MALLSAADLASGFVTSLVIGAWVDRLPRRPIMIGADLGRAALLMSIPVTATLHILRSEQLYLVDFLTGSLTLCFDVAYESFLPSLVSRDELTEGNSKLAASAAIAEAGAFSTGGWLVQVFTGPIAILLDAGSFFVSAVCIAGIQTTDALPQREQRGASLWAEILDGLRVVLHEPVLRAIVLSTMIAEACMRITGTVYLLFTTTVLGFHPGLLGLIFAVGGVGSLLGAMASGPLVRRVGAGPMMIVALLFITLGKLFVPLASGATLAAALLLIGNQLISDSAFTVYDIEALTLRQAIAPEQLLGRVNASARFATLGAMLAGTLLGGLLGERVGLRATLDVGVAGTFLAFLCLLISSARRLKAAPQPIGSSN